MSIAGKSCIIPFSPTWGTCRCDGIGRRSGLKIHRWRQRTGSSPVTGTNSSQAAYRLRRAFSFHCKAYRALLASKPNPLPLGFGLVLGTKLRAGSDPVQCAKKQSSEGAAVFLFGFHSRWPLHPSVFQCPGQMNCPSAKVFAAGENACTAHQRRRPDGRLSGISVNRSKKDIIRPPLASPCQLRCAPLVSQLAGVGSLSLQILILTALCIRQNA